MDNLDRFIVQVELGYCRQLTTNSFRQTGIATNWNPILIFWKWCLCDPKDANRQG